MTTVPQAIAVAGPQPVEATLFQCVGCGSHRHRRKPAVRADPRQRPFDLLRCGACGLVQQFPRYTAGQLAALYETGYYVFNESESLRWSRAVQQYIVHILPRETRRGKRLLDIGCALGHLSALARCRGWRVTGLDVSPQAVSRAAITFDHIDFRAGILSQHCSTLPRFDLVFLGDVIEHVPDPIDLLRDVGVVLAPAGIVCIDTPNWNSRWRKVGRGRWLGLNRYHINLFDADSLATLLEKCGFVDIQLGSYTHYRYEGWTRRPELQGCVRQLPDFLAWRVNRILSQVDRIGHWSTLRTARLTTLEEAHGAVSALKHDTPPTLKRSADNLIAAARHLRFVDSPGQSV